MPDTLRFIQANLARSPGAQLSFLNDRTIKDFSLLLVTEPNIRDVDGKPIVHQHSHWTAVRPTLIREDSVVHSFRSLIFVNKNTNFRQVDVYSPDITAGIVTTPTQCILAVSVYVPRPRRGHPQEELTYRLQLISKAYSETQEKLGRRIELLVTGDFNRHDPLWGGDGAVPTHHIGEGVPILEWMGKLGLTSLLPRGTITFQRGEAETTIDLALATERLTRDVLRCQVHNVEHGSDHRAIVTEICNRDSKTPVAAKMNFRKADWEGARRDLESFRGRAPDIESRDRLEHEVDNLVEAVQAAINRHTPLVRSSPYMKIWWDDELSNLRSEYTELRNRHARLQRIQIESDQLRNEVTRAKNRFHRAIRDKKRKHWRAFLENPDNIWKAARFLDPKESAFGNIPNLVDKGGRETESNGEKAKVLLDTFFPPTPDGWRTEGRPDIPAQQLENPDLEEQEVGVAVKRVSAWRAPGADGLPNVVWKETWPVLRGWITAIFQASLRLGELPRQWKIARILPLRKPDKDNYTLTKAYRPISLLSTLGKILEVVVARRISWWAEGYNLLPKNQFGARPRRSCEQALVLLVDKIKEAWRSNKVLSLISFDVKGAYNGVPCEVLASRLAVKGIPENIVRWIRSFCTNRRATVVVNGEETAEASIKYPGLPQGSPLAPVLYIFFNAGLVDEEIDRKGGSMGFVDDYSRWTVGATIETNMEVLQSTVIPRALQWAKDSGATFEPDKTTLLHFTRSTTGIQQPFQALRVGEAFVAPSKTARLLGVIFDGQLKFTEHLARASTRGWKSVQALLRLKGVIPRTARQLYKATVTSRTDYAAAVWYTRFIGKYRRQRALGAMNPIQRAAAKAITRCFKTVSVEAASAEAHLEDVHTRLCRKVGRFWLDLHTLPKDNPLHKCLENIGTKKGSARYRSPLCQMMEHTPGPATNMETIEAFVVKPWQHHTRGIVPIPDKREEAKVRCTLQSFGELQVFTGGLARNDRVGYGIATRLRGMPGINHKRTIGDMNEANAHIAELGAMVEAARWAEQVLNKFPGTWGATIYSDSVSALQAIANPMFQSGQRLLNLVAQVLDRVAEKGRRLEVAWVPGHDGIEGNEEADGLAKEATEQGATIDPPVWMKGKFKAVIAKQIREKLTMELIQQKWSTGASLRRIDSAIPGRHVLTLYNNLTSTEAHVLAQMRTGHSRLKSFLARRVLEEDDQCECGEDVETLRHFLLHCKRYDSQRRRMAVELGRNYGNISHMLGGRGSYQRPDGTNPDGPREAWKPKMEIVRTVIRFALETGRLGPRARWGEDGNWRTNRIVA